MPDSSAYQLLKSEIISSLSPYYDVMDLRQISNDSYESIDLCCKKCNQTDYLRAVQLIKWLFKSVAFLSKNQTLHFYYKHTLIKLYFTTTYNSFTCVYYHEYSTWGYLLNKLAEEKDNTLTCKGLSISNYVEINLITISEILDINYDAYLKGFKSFNEIFDLIVNSKLFCSRRFTIKYPTVTPKIMYLFIDYLLDKEEEANDGL